MSWVALILPYIEQSTVFNAINFSQSISGSGVTTSNFFATAWYTRINWLTCPSDGDQEGFRNSGSGNGDGQDISQAPPPPPGGGTPMVAVSDYGVSFGDNYCIGALNMGVTFPTETPYTLWPNPPGIRASAGPDIRARTPTSTVCFPQWVRQVLSVGCLTSTTARPSGSQASPTAPATPSPPERSCQLSVPTTTFGNGIPAATELPFRSAIHPGKAVPCPATVGVRRTGRRAAPTQIQASRATTPAAQLSVRGRIGPLLEADNRHDHLLRPGQPRRRRGDQLRRVLTDTDA